MSVNYKCPRCGSGKLGVEENKDLYSCLSCNWIGTFEQLKKI